MLKRTLACALFAITGHAYSADIQVTTLADEDKDDAVCSLREAVEFLNKRSQKEFENGYHGCGNKDASNNIILQREKEYILNSAITIKATANISTALSGDFNDSQKGMHNATIKIMGNDRLFVIDDGSVENNLIPVGFSEINFKGSLSKINDGGLILNREALFIQYSRLSGGSATRGGAIYNAGIRSEEQKTAGVVSVTNSLLENNKAEQGAVIYSEMPLYQIAQSVVRNNEGMPGSNGALLYVQTGFNDDTIGSALAQGSSGIKNSTFYNNKGGYIANIREGMLLNNLTVVKNAAGFYLQALKWKKTIEETIGEEKKEVVKEFPSSYVSNSIIVANGNNDFSSSLDDTTIVQSNFTTIECKSYNEIKCLPNVIWDQNNPEQTLISGDKDEGICTAPPAKGLLCPYYTPKDQMLGFFKPRLLVSYKQLTNSPIVNRGRIYSDRTDYNLGGCEGSDQRGKSRSGYDELCDFGAIELIVNRAEIPIVGQDIFYGQTAKFSVADSLLDGELLDPATCEAQLGKRPDGQPWQVGCLEVVQTQTASKGKLTIDQDGNVVYVPNGDWHGADKFNLRVMTTTTRFNDVSNYFINIPATIVQDPPNNFQSKTVNVSGGSLGIGAIFVLLGLARLRRFKS
ncbi:rhombotarget A [Acinetobacter sp. Ac_5812]|uniref:rhombotarget A n=1 Tax=Acinetobacter sp. Ac_5812 TaxID=1848937 RepID=UPI00148F572A|nr:rhombotarget A [Acinetobacter sp. Ac_5812]NNP70901.1 rhombotarget A [Acinetobacter sp. Ac_5812]